MEQAPILVEVTRGDTVESRHRGMIAVVNNRGEQIAHLGDTGFVTFLRSSAKPFQAIPVLTSGAAEHFQITNRELAIIIASHNGLDIHTDAVAGLLARAGLRADMLKCGVHPPYDKAKANELGPHGATVLHNNCSGKHTGMLAVCKFLGYDLASYDQPDHPLQQHILSLLARFADMSTGDIAIGVDGCGVPTFALSLYRMALLYAHLVNPNEDRLELPLRQACARVTTAMMEFPEMVGSTHGRFDSDLMNATRGRLIAKVGAEGVYTVGVMPNQQYPTGLGVSVKIEDGDDRRVRAMVVCEVLKQLGVLNNDELEQLAHWRRRDVRNRRGEVVGHIEPAFQLSWSCRS